MPPPIPTNEPVPPVVDNADAPVVFADVMEGGGPFNGNLNLTFSVLQLDHTQNPPIEVQALNVLDDIIGALHVVASTELASIPEPSGGPPS